MRHWLSKAMLCTFILSCSLSFSALASEVEGQTQPTTETTVESTTAAPAESTAAAPAEGTGEAPSPTAAPAEAAPSQTPAAISPTPTPAIPGNSTPLSPAPGYTLSGEKDPDICAHLGEDYYLLTISPEKGNVFANASGRTFIPSTQTMGHYIGYTLTGQALISDDAYTIADILGADYRLLAYTPDRGNCYVNALNMTYTPATNEVGMVTGRNEDGLPIITITGLMVPVTNYSIISNQGSVAPASGQTVGVPTPTPAQPPAQAPQEGFETGQ